MPQRSCANVLLWAFLTTLIPAAVLADEGAQVTPSCARPAPLYGKFAGSSGVVVDLWSDVPGAEPHAIGLALARRYGFKIEYWRKDASYFLVAALAPGEIAKLRCERVVSYITYSQPVMTPSGISRATAPGRRGRSL